jgi:hypothetical protein
MFMPMHYYIQDRGLRNVTAVATATPAISMRQGHARQVPNSVDTAPPKLKTPVNACEFPTHPQT